MNVIKETQLSEKQGLNFGDTKVTSAYHCCVCTLGGSCLPESRVRTSVLSSMDSLVGLYFEVSAFLKLVSIFVPAKGRAGVPRCLALQVQLFPFCQTLAWHQPKLRSIGWTEGERGGGRKRERNGERKSKLAFLKLTTDIQLIYHLIMCVRMLMKICLWRFIWGFRSKLRWETDKERRTVYTNTHTNTGTAK